MIYVESKRRKVENIQKAYPDAKIIDVTSKAELPFLKFSPFYPIGKIPIPFSEGYFSESMEGIWQGLKVFEASDIDASKFTNTKMKGLKRTVRKNGIPLGHRKGIHSKELLGYIQARKEIYLPAYNWILKHRLSDEIQALENIHKANDIVLLDYETNEDVNDPKKPLSHASLIKQYLLRT